MRIKTALLGAALTIFNPIPSHAADKAGPPAEVPGTLVDAAAVSAPSCYLQALAGSTVEAVKTNVLPASISAHSWSVGLGAGCDVKVSRFVVGALARIEVPIDTDARLLDTDYSYMVAARGGYLINSGLLAYGLVGFAGNEFGRQLFDIANTGIVYGGGLEVMLTKATSLTAEYTQTHIGSTTAMGVKLEPVEHKARVGFSYRFGSLFE